MGCLTREPQTKDKVYDQPEPSGSMTKLKPCRPKLVNGKWIRTWGTCNDCLISFANGTNGNTESRFITYPENT